MRALRCLLALPLIALTLTSVPSFEGRGIADTFRAGTTKLVSTYSDGSPADGGAPSVSSDGRYVAFDSWDRLSPEDTNDYIDVYRKDMTTGQTVLVSVEIAGLARGPYNFKPSISGDGSKVAYLSGWCYFGFLFFFSLHELPSCPGMIAHVRDLSAGTTIVTSDTRYVSDGVQISRNGDWVAMLHQDVGYWLMVGNTLTGARTYVAPVCSCLNATTASISATGRHVAFESLDPVIPSDTDGNWDVYLYDRDTDANGIFDEAGKTSMQIVGIRPNGDSAAARWPAISDDGKTIAFIGGDVAFLYVYVRDLQSATTTVVSQNSFPAPSFFPAALTVSGDGRKVGYPTYNSYPPTLDANPGQDVLLFDRLERKTYLGSVLPDGTQGIGDRLRPSLSSGAGRFLAFETTITGFHDVDDGARYDRRVYLRDLSTPCTAICLEPSLAPPNEPTPEAVVVDSRNSSGSLTVLPSVYGEPYRITARGVYQYGLTWATALADANCASLDGVNFYSNLYPSFPAGILKLLVNNQIVSWTPYPGTEAASDPACSTEHHYLLDVVGDGNLVRFAISDTDYSDNLGALEVTLVPSSS